MILENIRYMLYQYNPKTALYFGHRFAVKFDPYDFGSYMAGGGYILSKKALEKFATKIVQNASHCSAQESGSEDWEIGRCLERYAIPVDERDEQLGKRFFPAGIYEHLKKNKDQNYWYDNSQYYEVPQGNLSCCSKTPVNFHYIPPSEMYLLDYLTRIVHPFGIDKSSSETLPKKLKLKEILYKSDVESKSVIYRKHNIYHEIEESEKYRRKRNV